MPVWPKFWKWGGNLSQTYLQCKQVSLMSLRSLDRRGICNMYLFPEDGVTRRHHLGGWTNTHAFSHGSRGPECAVKNPAGLVSSKTYQGRTCPRFWPVYCHHLTLSICHVCLLVLHTSTVPLNAFLLGNPAQECKSICRVPQMFFHTEIRLCPLTSYLLFLHSMHCIWFYSHCL